jgi:hypothetical protein
MTMGRPILGPALVDRLDGSERAKLIARTMLETIAGTRSIDDAATALDCNRAYIHALRERLLAAMVDAAEPRPHGPPPAPEPDPTLSEALKAAQVQARNAEVALELERCRHELALAFGPRLHHPKQRKKNRRRR